MDEIWNNDEMIDVRRKMVAGTKLKHCQTCYMHEAVGKHSNRQRVNEDWYPEEMWMPQVEHSLGNGFVVGQTPKRIDLKFGNLCNLQCRMCSGTYSTQINKDITALRKLDPSVADEFGINVDHVDFNWYEEERFWEIIDRYIPLLRDIHWFV